MTPARLVAGLTVALLAGCVGEAPSLKGSGSAPVAAESSVVVQAGDTLYSIAFRRGLDYREVARWNGIGTDYRIYIGQTLTLKPPAAGVAVPVVPPPVAEPAPGAPPHWTWPTDGPVLGTVTQPTGGVGLKVGGQSGADVRAAAAGRVVYVGSGLRAYGLLVILKHDESWLSAYGYNQDALVREGDSVREGQPIAHLGSGPAGVPMLYFEIRRQGKPVDPLQFLPKR